MDKNSENEIIQDGKKYTLIGVVEDASIDNILFDYKTNHPKVLDKSLKLFEMLQFKNFSIEHAHICLYGLNRDFNISAKCEDIKLRTYTLWHYNNVELNLEDENLLYDIEYNTEFLSKKLRRQPFKSYYVRLNYQYFYGFFVSKGFYLEDEDFCSRNNSSYNSNELFLSLVLYDDNEKIFHANFNINLSQSGDLRQIIEKSWYDFLEISPSQLPETHKESVQQLFEAALFAINVMYFISDINSKRPELFESAANRHKKADPNKPFISSKTPNEYERKLITSYKTTTISIIANHNGDINKKSPHVRKGHWHTYWVGKMGTKQRRRIIKWVEETVVNCNNRKNLPNVKIKP